MSPWIRSLLASLVLLGAGLPASAAGRVDVRVEIREPAPDRVLPPGTTEVEVVGGASIYGGVQQLDLFLVVDTSESLRRTDKQDHRTAGVIGLVQSLHPKSDIHVGVVDFDKHAQLLMPLTADRDSVVRALRRLDRKGETNIAAGIRAALEGFAQRGRPGASRAILLFTDGNSDPDDARAAAAEAEAAGVAIHALLLGDDEEGRALLPELAARTGASFLHVTDPARLPEAFKSLRTTGIDRVTIAANGAPAVPAELVGGTFSARIPLREGGNQLVATARSLDGRTAQHAVRVFVPGPLRLSIDAPLDGTLVTEREAETRVTGLATTLAEEPEALDGEAPDLVQGVLLTVNDSRHYEATLAGGRFEGRIALEDGENRVVATATTVDGRTLAREVQVTLRAQGCAELAVEARRGGRPTLSLSERAVEIVFDASNSMWGRMDGRPKIEVAKEILRDALDWMPEDLTLSLRVYGHQRDHAAKDCQDSALLVPVGVGNRDGIRTAIGQFKPRGQTPLAYALGQVAGDLGGFRGERAVVLVTDGIESCGGDPVAAASGLQVLGRIPVHVIGFGLSGAQDADPASLRAIADASGGRFLAARSAAELREALSVTVGTPFEVRRDGRPVARGALGAEALHLPPGDYRLLFDSAPPIQVPVALASEQGTTLLLKREAGKVFHAEEHHEIAYTRCEVEPAAEPEATVEGPRWQELPGPAAARGAR